MLQLPLGVLVADAGGTKVDWAIGSGDRVRFLRTEGIHPQFQDGDAILTALRKEKEKFDMDPATIERIHFYGAGCSSDIRRKRVEKGLRGFFPHASIRVEHDMLGAARAVSGKEPGLVAILGTGSNACSYDGERIVEQSGGLGFVLGDEGSGAHMGKLLLRDYLNGELPEGIGKAFQDRFPQSRDEHIDAIHRGEAPSRYLASFAPFLKEHEEEEHVHSLIRTALMEFVERHLLRFEGGVGSVLHTVGGVGEHFREVLREVLKRSGIFPGGSMEDPIRGLVAYHGVGREGS